MFHDINNWRCQIGIFAGNAKYVISRKRCLRNHNTYLSCNVLLFLLNLYTLQLKFTYTGSIYLFFSGSFSIDLLFLFIFQNILAIKLLLRCGDVESNPGPKDKLSLSICHYNINSIAVHNFAKLSSLEAFNSVHSFDIICISESFLDSSFCSNDSALNLKGFKLVRADHPLDVKRGRAEGTCIYYKEILPIKFLNIVNLPECLLCEISYEDQKCFIVSLYRSPSQSANEFQEFLKELEVIIESICTPGNSDHIIIIGDFNAKLSTWKSDDPDTAEFI